MRDAESGQLEEESFLHHSKFQRTKSTSIIEHTYHTTPLTLPLHQTSCASVAGDLTATTVAQAHGLPLAAAVDTMADITAANRAALEVTAAVSAAPVVASAAAADSEAPAAEVASEVLVVAAVDSVAPAAVEVALVAPAVAAVVVGDFKPEDM